MRDYGAVSPKFWFGETGKALRGSANEQVLALYLMTSPHANMIGVYHCPILYMAHETGLGEEGASKALASLIERGFCEYDELSETVFVVKMAAFQIAESLSANDKRVVGIQRDVERMSPGRIKDAFIAAYSKAFHLSPIQAPSKPLPSQDKTGQDKTYTAPKSRQTSMPSGFAISDRVRTWAGEKGFSAYFLDANFEAFVSYVKRKAPKYVDWDEALMTAIRDNWAKVPATPSGSAAWAGAK